jgi:hypothetical protein
MEGEKRERDYSQGEDLLVKVNALAMMASGKGIRELERELDIPYSTLRQWKNGKEFASFVKDHLLDVVLAKVTLIAETQAAILKGAQKPEWIDKQNAADLAEFNESLNNMQSRLIEIFDKAEQRASGPKALDRNVSQVD